MAFSRTSQVLARPAVSRLRGKQPSWSRVLRASPIVNSETACLSSPSPSPCPGTGRSARVPPLSAPISSSTTGHSFRAILGHGSGRGIDSWVSRRFSTAASFAFQQTESFAEKQEACAEDAAKKVGGEGIEISKLPISPLLISGLAKRGITTLFPVQRAVLEPALKGQDLIARAKTGTGKTLAFGIPILDKTLREQEKRIRGYGRAPLAVILAPTRELAKQVETELKESSPTTEVMCAYGGVSIDAQVRQIQSGIDILVGTPGRVIDLLNRGALKLGEVQYFVLDEADRMLAVGFEEDVEKILQHLPSQKQSLLFSATMPDWVKKLAGKYLKNHIIVDLVGDNDDKIAEGIKLLSISTSMTTRRPMLSDLITVYGKGCKSIVFTQTKREADDISSFLGQKLGSEALHGDISQHQREKTLKSFRDGRLNVLVATDVAARGLDISNVDLVIHYEAANDTETFVHRSGRTGRAGKKGIAILMYMEQQRRLIDNLERELGCKFENIEPPTLEDVIRSSAHQAVTKIEAISTDLRNVFLPTAEKLIADHGPGALAAAIAHVCGCTQLPTSRSLISYEQGFMTLKVTRPGGLPITGSDAVTQFVRSVLPSAASSIGKIRMLNEIGVQGAVFDLPEQLAKTLLSTSITTGEVLEAPQKLPKIVEDAFGSGGFGRSFSPRPFGSRFGSGGYSGGGGGYSGGGGGYSGGSGGYSGGGGSYSGGSGSYSGGGGGYSRSGGGSSYSGGGGSYSSPNRYQGSSGSDFSSRSNIGSSWSNSSNSTGTNNWSSSAGSGMNSWSNRSSNSSSTPSSSYSFGSFGSNTSGASSSEVKCLRCGKLGHRIGDCYEKLT